MESPGHTGFTVGHPAYGLGWKEHWQGCPSRCNGPPEWWPLLPGSASLKETPAPTAASAVSKGHPSPLLSLWPCPFSWFISSALHSASPLFPLTCSRTWGAVQTSGIFSLRLGWEAWVKIGAILSNYLPLLTWSDHFLMSCYFQRWQKNQFRKQQ